MLQDNSMACILVGTETDRAAADAIVSRLGSRVVDLVGKTTTGQLAAVLRRCDLLLSNDGGVAHLAAAVQTRTLTVFGPSNDAAWHPLGGAVIASDVPCRPCFYRDFEIGLRYGCTTRECLAQITPVAVAARALALMEDAPIGV
jgi:ADP-heptose:LPS heptosyltransferase